MIHFSEAELRAWSQSGPGPDRERVVAHVGACAQCAAAYADAMRAASLTRGEVPVAEPGDIADFVNVGYQVPARSGSVAARPQRRRMLIALAAAAALIVAVAIPYARYTREPHDEIRLRGDAVQALAPIGTVDAGTEFQWSPAAAAASYRLDIGDSTGALFTMTTKETRARLPAAGGPALTPGIDYWWTVTVLDADHREVASSGRQTFRIRAR